jgi:D-serine deaminase-like pyridoxal phosphate-dependent protein
MVEVDWRTKGLWLPDGPVDAAEFVAAGHRLFDPGGPFAWPLMVVRRSAVEANVAAMAAYCRQHGVELAPHGKTTMSPTLFRAQVDAGAWGITVATAQQALVARRGGIARVLLANEVLDPRVLRWAAAECAAGWEFLSYVDSIAGVKALAAAQTAADGRLRVLVEIGYPGGRTGCRGTAEAKAVARAARAVPGVEVAGVAGFEGLLPDVEAAANFIGVLREAAEAVAPLCTGRPIVSAGGSAFFDAVVAGLTDPGIGDWRVILRSGTYVTHDHGMYARIAPGTRGTGPAFTPALEVWAQVLSTPEPGLALVGAGRRDVPYDSGLPVVLGVRGADGAVGEAGGAVVTAVNDQHAYVTGLPAAPGDLVRLGISHPCTAFDKWRIVPVVDDDDTVVDLLDTYF